MPYLKRLPPSPEPIDCKILTAALALFVNKGYHNVSIHEIQKRADVSIGSIYRHFGGKEGVALKLYSHVMNEANELIDAITERIDHPIPQIEQIIKELFEHTETHEDIISFIFHAKHTEFLTSKPLMCDTKPFIKIREIIALGIENGDIKNTNPWVATSLIFGGAIRMIQLRLDGTIEKPLTNYIDVLMTSLWEGLRDDTPQVAKQALYTVA